jgi:3-phosphoshikimate 1-carboxyvinyltransferase
MHSGRVSLDASESSQFASALLFALPTLEGDSVLRLTGPIVSAPYLEATLAVLARHRVRVESIARVYRIPGGQRYRGTSFRVPGDASSAAYLWTAGAITGGKVRVTGLPEKWPQADQAILSLLDQAGAKVTRIADGATVQGPVDRPFSVDLTDTPDLYPLAGVLAAVVQGHSLLLGASHVAVKESDRKAGTERVARGLGAHVRPVPGGLAIEGTDSPRPLSLPDLSDHRMVMSAAVGALAAEGRSSIGDARAVDKSFPRFWEVLSRLSGGVEGR